MEMNPEDDDKPATRGGVRFLGKELRDEIAALREEMVTRSMFQNAFQSLTKSIADLGENMQKQMDRSVMRRPIADWLDFSS